MTINQKYLNSPEFFRDLKAASRDFDKASRHFMNNGDVSKSAEYSELSRRALKDSVSLEFKLQGIDIEI